MMEVLAIGLAALGWPLAIWLCVQNLALKRVQAKWEKTVDSALALAQQASEIIDRNATAMRAFDHDGDGKPGGSKPRGKG